MGREEAEKLLRGGARGVLEWNSRRDVGESIPNLREMDFEGASLTGINLSGAKILGGNFACCKLRRANFRQAILYGSGFFGAEASEAIFVGSDLRHADFSPYPPILCPDYVETDLSGADFSYARLYRADFCDANIRGARFVGAHFGHTILDSREVFLGGSSGATLDGIVHPNAPAMQEPKAPDFGNWLGERRASMGWSEAELARRLDVGLTGIDIRMFEKRNRYPSGEVGDRLVCLLGPPNSPISGMPSPDSWLSCPRCGQTNSRRAHTCENCGGALGGKTVCLDCGFLQSVPRPACEQCGTIVYWRCDTANTKGGTP